MGRPTIHPRSVLVSEASNELREFLSKWHMRHETTLAEELNLLGDCIQVLTANHIRAERFFSNDEKAAAACNLVGTELRDLLTSNQFGDAAYSDYATLLVALPTKICRGVANGEAGSHRSLQDIIAKRYIRYLEDDRRPANNSTGDEGERGGSHSPSSTALSPEGVPES